MLRRRSKVSVVNSKYDNLITREMLLQVKDDLSICSYMVHKSILKNHLHIDSLISLLEYEDFPVLTSLMFDESQFKNDKEGTKEIRHKDDRIKHKEPNTS